MQREVITTISELFKEKESDFYIESLESKNNLAKWPAVIAISKHSGEKGIPAVIKRVKTMLSQKRDLEYNQPLSDSIELKSTELTDALQYLNRFANFNDDVIKCFKYVIKKWDRVWKHEQMKIGLSVKYFRDNKYVPERQDK